MLMTSRSSNERTIGREAVVRRIFVAFIALMLMPAGGAWAQTAFKLRASLDTSATHARTIAVTDFLKQLQDRSGGRIQTELFHSGALFRDRDVAKALRQGAVEMAVPGNWVLTSFVSNADIFDLPCLFGQPTGAVYVVADGKAGQMIDDELQKKLEVVVLGPWLPLGYNNIYTTAKVVKSFDDLAGMKIRNSGGAGQALRARFFGAQPNVTAWPDVPLALSQGTFEGVASTDESLASAKLWESGIHFGFADKEFIGFYIPMLSQSFYSKLPPDLQKLVTDVWRENIAGYRAGMERAQAEARKTLEQHGVQFVLPSDQALAAMRARMMPKLDEWAKELRISSAMLDLVKADCKNTGS